MPAGESFVTKGAMLMEELGMWVAVPARAIVGSTGTAAAGETLAQHTSGAMSRQHSRSAAGPALSGKHDDLGMPAESEVPNMTAPQPPADPRGSAKPVRANSSAVKVRHGRAAGSDQQPLAASRQRQRPRPRRAPAVPLAVITDRAADRSDAGLISTSAGSVVIPIYERADAALGDAAPAHPAARGSAPAQDRNVLDAGDLLKSNIVARPACSADAMSDESADGRVPAAARLGASLDVLVAASEMAPAAVDSRRSVQQSTEESAHSKVQPTATNPAQHSMGKERARASGAQAAMPLPAVATLSLTASRAVPSGEHRIARTQRVGQHANAGSTRVPRLRDDVDATSQRPGSAAEQAAHMPSPSALLQTSARHSNGMPTGKEMQPDTAGQPDAASAVADTSAAAHHHRPMKRRREAVALGSYPSTTGKPPHDSSQLVIKILSPAVGSMSYAAAWWPT